jgi:DNA-binding NtrC family response regulator
MKYRLFIVEDDPHAGVRYLMALRESEHFDAELFSSMEDANAAAAARGPHVLLADIRLDQAAGAKSKDATEYLAEIRAGKTNFDRRVPVVLFTGEFPNLGAETFKRAVALGANALLLKDKDITPEIAASVLKRLLDEAQANDEVVAALKLAREQSDEQTIPFIQVAEGISGEGVTIDDIIEHMKLNDDFARRFRTGLYSIALAMLQGSGPKKT